MNPKELFKTIFKVTKWNFLGILLLIGISLFLFKDIQNQLKKIDLIKKDIFNQELTLLRTQTLDEEWKKAEEYYNKLLSILPSEKDLLKLEENIKALSNRYPVNLDFRFGSLNSLANEPLSYNYSLVLTGSKSQVLSCFKEFQKITPAIRVEQTELKFVSSDPNKDEVELKVLGRIYLH